MLILLSEFATLLRESDAQSFVEASIIIVK